MRHSILFALALAACANPDYPRSITNNPDEDFDGDGLTNGEELAGWSITVNATGYPDDVLGGLDALERAVVSDPLLADSDGDGLSDLEERDAGTDPGSPDTDADLLTDLEELQRWRTNPTQADTDGDALTPGGQGAPLQRLFDGAELDLTQARDAGPLATSPLLADTDGDGFSDHEELTQSARDPGLAEQPGLRVQLTPGTVLDLSVDVTYSGDTVESVSHRSSIGVSSARSTESLSSMSAGSSSEISTRQKAAVGLTAGCCLDFVNLNFSTDQEYRASMSFETMGSTGLNRTDSNTSTQTHSDMVERTTTTAHTIDGALVQASVDISNPTSRTYEVRGMSVVLLFREGGELKPLGVLTSAEDSVVLAPGETARNVLLTDTSANPQRVQEMMRAPGRVLISPASFDLVDVTNTPVAFQQELVLERTASLTLRWPDEVERFHIAVNAARDADGELVGMNVDEILAKLGIEGEERDVENPVTGEVEPVLFIDGVGAAMHVDDTDPLEELDAPGYTVSGGPGPRNVAESWVGLIFREDGDPELASLLDARLMPGDAMEIVRALDRDRDGLADVEELVVGTSDGLADSDAVDGESDGLSDFFEVNEPWEVVVDDREPYLVHGDPTSMDADNDGLHDGEEYAAGTDPRLADTDGDGWSDSSELDAGQDPLFRDSGPDDMEIQCRTTHVNGDWMYEVLIDLPPGLAVAIGSRRGDDTIEIAFDPEETMVDWVQDYPEDLGPAPTVYVRDELGLEHVVQCPEPEYDYGKTCFNCDPSPPSVTCTVDPNTGEMAVSVEDAGDDLVRLDFALRPDVKWRSESLVLVPDIFGNPLPWIAESTPVSLGARDTLDLVRDAGMVGTWDSRVDPLAFEGRIGNLTSMDWAFDGGWTRVTEYLEKDPATAGFAGLRDTHYLNLFGFPHGVTPHTYDVELEVTATDVDGNLAGATCEYELPTPRSCLAIHEADPSKPSGTYAIDPDGPGGLAQEDVYCDMTTNGGGWTLVRYTEPSLTWGPFNDKLTGTNRVGTVATSWPSTLR